MAVNACGHRLFADLLAEKVVAHPDKDFVIHEDGQGRISTLSYAQFAGQVDRLCNSMLASGVLPGQTIALMMGNCPAFLVAWMAINQAGAVMVPVNVFYVADELKYLLSNAECVGFIAEEKFTDLFEQVAPACPQVRIRICTQTADPPLGFELLDQVLARAETAHRVVRVPPQAPAQIIFTSGTTSRPKGAVISHQASLMQGLAVSQSLGMSPEERSAVVLPLFHVNGQYVSVIPTLTVGGTVVLLETYSASRYWEQVRRHDCTFISIVPMQLRTLLAQPEHPDDACHRIRVSFYALPTTDEEWDRFEKRFGVKLVEGYGLSETLGICTVNPLYGMLKRHCIGLPLLGREVRVIDDAGQDLSCGQVGRILVRGEPMFSGYFRNDEATRACMLEGGWFDTGDNGSLDEGGYLHFFDRSKDVIKRAGENIAATEVERVLNEHPGIAESAVISVPDPLRDEAVKAFVVLRPGVHLDAAEVQAWCAQHLAKFKVPSFVEFIGELPKTSIGKIVKYILKRDHCHEKNLPRNH
jgi:crotonobetaine/carnitine-CoA ligase